MAGALAAAVVLVVGLVVVMVRQAGTRATGPAGGAAGPGVVRLPGQPSLYVLQPGSTPAPSGAVRGLSLAQAGASGAARVLPGAVGGTVGVGAGVLGVGVSAARGDVAGTTIGALSTVGSAGQVGLVGTGATLGGVPVTQAGAAVAAEAAGVGAGTTATGAVVGASIAGAAASIAAVIGVGWIIKDILNIALGWGDRGLKGYIQNRNEAGVNASSTAIQNAGGGAKSLRELLAIILATKDVGHGEVVFGHSEYGGAGTWDTPASAPFVQAVEAAAVDENALVRFIRGLKVYTGHTGATRRNYVVTDWWRRELAARAGFTRADVERLQLFEPTPREYQPVPMALHLVESVQAGGRDPAEIDSIILRIRDGAPLFDPWEASGRRFPLSERYRDPAELVLTDTQRRSYIAALQEARARWDAVSAEQAAMVG